MTSRSEPSKLSDDMLARRLATLRFLEMEVLDPRVPYRRVDWGGWSRVSAACSLANDIGDLLAECDRRGVDSGKALREGHMRFKATHPELRGTVTALQAELDEMPAEPRPGREETLPW